MRRAIAYSFAVEATVSVVLIATFKMASDAWGAEGFGAWSLARRIISFALPLTTIGIETALPRYIAYDSRQSSVTYLLAASVVMLFGVGITSALLLAAPAYTSSVLFGAQDLQRLVVPLWMLLVAYSLHILFFAYIRGRFHIPVANLLHLWAFGVAPLLAFNLATQTPESAMRTIAVLVGGPALVLTASELLRQRPRFDVARGLIRRLATFGFSRMLSSLGLTLLALLPPLAVAKQSGLASAGAVALGITLIGFSGTLMAPVALSLLPAAARQSGSGDVSALTFSFRVTDVLALPIAGGAFACIWIVAPLLGEMFLAPEAELGAQVLRIAGAGAGCYAVFAVVRSILDATTEEAKVLHCTLIAGAVFALVWSCGAWLQLTSAPLLAMTAYTAAIITLTVSVYAFARRSLARAGAASGSTAQD